MNTVKVIILAGQSNAVGVGLQEYLPRHFSAEKIAEFRAGYESVLIHYFSHDMRNEGFEKTALGMAEKNKASFGPEVGMAEALKAKFPDETFYIIKSAVGGTNLFHDWLPPSCEGHDPDASDAEGEHYRASGWCFNEMIRTVGDGIRMLEEQGLQPEIRGFCWMQGESDSFEAETAANYAMRYRRMLADFNAVYGAYTENCTYVDAAISEKWPLYREINAAKQEHALSAKNSVYLDTIAEGLITTKEPEPECDWPHYDSDCTIKLGQLFVESIPL